MHLLRCVGYLSALGNTILIGPGLGLRAAAERQPYAQPRRVGGQSRPCRLQPYEKSRCQRTSDSAGAGGQLLREIGALFVRIGDRLVGDSRQHQSFGIAEKSMLGGVVNDDGPIRDGTVQQLVRRGRGRSRSR